MIKIQDSVPSIYYNSSRDFQLLGHLFDLVLNSTKTEADLLFNLPLSTNSDDQLLDLMTFTLGLRLNKAKYTSRQLRAICSVAPRMMRLKGSQKAVELLCTALMRADSAEGNFSLVLNEGQTELTVYITSYATCRDALQEVLPYILPAGMVFKIKESSGLTYNTITSLSLSDEVKVAIGKLNSGDKEISQIVDNQLANIAVDSPVPFVITEPDNIELRAVGSASEILPGLICDTLIYDPTTLEEVTKNDN
jgi:hypothetical protein